MNFEDDPFLYVCERIERELCAEYELNAALTDTKCIFALDRAKIAVKQAYGFAKNENPAVDPSLQGITTRMVALARAVVDESNGPTLRDFTARIDKIARTVRRHSHDGNRAYFEFVRDYLK